MTRKSVQQFFRKIIESLKKGLQTSISIEAQNVEWKIQLRLTPWPSNSLPSFLFPSSPAAASHQKFFTRIVSSPLFLIFLQRHLKWIVEVILLHFYMHREEGPCQALPHIFFSLLLKYFTITTATLEDAREIIERINWISLGLLEGFRLVVRGDLHKSGYRDRISEKLIFEWSVLKLSLSLPSQNNFPIICQALLKSEAMKIPLRFNPPMKISTSRRCVEGKKHILDVVVAWALFREVEKRREGKIYSNFFISTFFFSPRSLVFFLLLLLPLLVDGEEN